MLRILAVITLTVVAVSGITMAQATKKTTEIEMLQLTGGWTPVISVHGFYDNRAVANDIVRGLAMVSQADGHIARKYRVQR